MQMYIDIVVISYVNVLIIVIVVVYINAYRVIVVVVVDIDTVDFDYDDNIEHIDLSMIHDVFPLGYRFACI